MRIFIDIDGVLAFSNVPALARHCNLIWSFGISEERLTQIARLEDLNAQPEVAVRREERGSATFERELAWMQFDPMVISADLVAPGAVNGVQCLSHFGEVSYCTARYIHDEARQQCIIEATHRWLRKHQFVHDENIVFCDRIAGKLDHLLHLARESADPFMLIDDSATRILELVAQMKNDDRDLLRYRLTLVAFTSSTAPPSSDLRVLPLRRWHDIDSVVKHLQRGGHDTATL